MAKFWSDILVPLAIAGCIAAQTVGVEASRASRVAAFFPKHPQDTQKVALPDSVKAVPQDTTKKVTPPDTLLKEPQDTNKKQIPDTAKVAVSDSLKVAPLDSLAEEDEFDLFGPLEDTVPQIFARDTMHVPDSLRLTDPFLYQWYVATKDSYTHRLVVDSLKAEGDSLIWPQIDSLFQLDSIAVAKAAWEAKWATMSKAERKRWTYENVKLPAIRRKQDSILRRKDSIQHIKDSITQNTPRILETSYLPDSLQYKRLVTWKHDRLYNSMEVFQWDTTANYHFYDYPFMRNDVGASWLGMPGSAVQQYNWFERDKETSTSFYQALESWSYTADNLTQFNTKTPYTELEYSGNILSNTTLASDNFRVTTTQNILPSLNVAAEMKRYGGAGILKNEKTSTSNYFVSGNYLGKRYLAHAGFIYNKSSRQESGGVRESYWIRDTLVDVREIDVNLAAASNRYKKMTVFYDQSYRIPFDFIETLRHRGDTNWVKPDTVNTNIMTGFIGTSTEYTTYAKKYVDNTDAQLSQFYNGQFFINPNKSADSLRTMRLENRIFVRFQPWKEQALVSKIEGGVGNRLQTFYLQEPNEVLYKSSTHRWNSFYAYAGAEGLLGRYLNWDATGLVNFAGAEAGDFYVKANAKVSIYPFRRAPQSPISLSARFETRLQEPDFYQQHFYSNHFKWENDFSKISTTRIQAQLDIPRWKLRAQVGYALLANNVYYDTLGIARQNTTPMSVLSAALTKDFAFGPVHLDNSALLQFSSNQEVLPLPLLALNLRWYLQFNIVDPKVLQLQAGVNVRFNTLWYAPAYNPVAGVFHHQKEEQYGNTPVFDVFVNMQWKKCCIFLKMENLGKGWPMSSRDYFTSHHYIQAPAMFKLGISWPFYPHLGTQKTMSARASSSFSGGGDSGGGGGGGGFGGGLGGMLGGGNR